MESALLTTICVAQRGEMIPGASRDKVGRDARMRTIVRARLGTVIE